MATLQGIRAVDEEPFPGDARWELVCRIRSGPLQSAPRLQQLLTYLCECALRAPDEHISEERIGVRVFERREGYDTSVDTIVRVQVSQLRRKLGHYFVAEGRGEPVVVELPKGSYLPRFQRRRAEVVALLPDAPPSAAEPAEVPAPTRRWVLAAAGLAVACLILLVDDVRLRRREAGAEGPHVGHLWQQFAANGLPTQVVLSDAGLAQLSDALGRAVTLGEYRKASYPFALSERLAFEPRAKAMVEQAAVKGLTAPQDARVAADVAALLQRHGAAAQVVSARNVQVELGADQNLVLLGSRRANPWMEMFEAELPFRYEFDEAHRTASVTHAAAGPAATAVYRVEWGRKSYVVVAFVPKPRGNGNALLVYAADFLATAAAGQFLADEQGLAQLYATLDAAPAGPVPYFAALLRADLAGHAATNYELIEAGRVPTPGR